MFRKHIREAYPALSPSYQRVADFILDHYHEAVFMSANQLGMALGVDAATVVRFAQKLGYTGYPDLLEDLRKAIRHDLYRARTAPTGANDMISTTLAALDVQIENLHAMRASLNEEDMTQVLERILSARRIYVTGEGVSRRLAELGVYGLRVIGLEAIMVEPNVGDALAEFGQASAEDLLLVIACTELCPAVIKIARAMRDRGVPRAAIVGALSWPVARLVDLALPAPIQSVTFFTNFTAAAALINALGEGLLARQGTWMMERARGITNLARALLNDDSPVDSSVPGDMMARLNPRSALPTAGDERAKGAS